MTPRFTVLIVKDRTTQNTLAVFIGAYVLSVIDRDYLRELGCSTTSGRLSCFIMTVIVLIVCAQA